MTLPAVSMLTVWSGGDAGNIGYPGWLGLGVFIGLVLRNALVPGSQLAAATPQTRASPSLPMPTNATR